MQWESIVATERGLTPDTDPGGRRQREPSLHETKVFPDRHLNSLACYAISN